MAKKIYHIPLEKMRAFISKEKTYLHKMLKEKQTLEYCQRLGKMRYDEQVENFLIFFKIDKNISYALKNMDYFASKHFIDEMALHLNFVQFDLPNPKTKRDFFYGLFYLLHSKDKPLFEVFLHQIFLHYHASFNAQSNISIDYKEIAQTLLKIQNKSTKESFGEDDSGAFFRVFVDEEECVGIRGKSIKSLRKEAYKLLLRELIGG